MRVTWHVCIQSKLRVVFMAIIAHLGSFACFVYEVMNIEGILCLYIVDWLSSGNARTMACFFCVWGDEYKTSVNKSVVLRAGRHGLFVMLFVCVSTLCMCDNVSMVCKLVTRHNNVHVEIITHYTQDNLCFCEWWKLSIRHLDRSVAIFIWVN